MESKRTLIKYGWSKPDVIALQQQWCQPCFKFRWFEYLDGHGVCMACTDVVAAPDPIVETLEAIDDKEAFEPHPSLIHMA